MRQIVRSEDHNDQFPLCSSALQPGTDRALHVVVANRPAARKHTELETWQIANELRRLVLKSTKPGGTAMDFKFRDQMRDAVRSACRNTSEGFYRYGHGEFGQFLVVAYGSLGEVLDCIDDGRECGYFSTELAEEMRNLANRAMVTNLRLRQSWKQRKNP